MIKTEIFSCGRPTCKAIEEATSVTSEVMSCVDPITTRCSLDMVATVWTGATMKSDALSPLAWASISSSRIGPASELDWLFMSV